MSNMRHALVGGMIFGLASICQAELFDRGNGTVYDSQQDITWLQSWNVNGKKTWAEHTSWATDLVFAGGSDWAIPSIDQYLKLATEGGYTRTVGSPFVNSVFDKYVTSTEVSPGSISIRIFGNDGIYQTTFLKSQKFYAVAIHPGDLAAVPEPSAVALAFVGVGMIFGAVKSRKI